MKILFVGDVVGRLGRKTMLKLMPRMRREYGADFVIANIENAAHGSGVTENVLKEFLDLKINCFTSGDHAFANKKQFDVFEKYPILRPANFPPKTPGKGYAAFEVKGKTIVVINLIGRVFMKQDFDCPFRKFDEILANINLHQKKVFAIIVDIHAEASSEKVCFKHYVDGKVAAVLGTHTHVPTADAELSLKNTAYITDAGMCGYADGSLGLDEKDLIKTYLTQIKYPHVLPEQGNAVLNAVLIDLNEKTGMAQGIEQITKKIKIK